MKYHVDLHAIVDADISVREGHELAHNLKDTLRMQISELGHVLIHIEPNESWERELFIKTIVSLNHNFWAQIQLLSLLSLEIYRIDA